MSYILHALKKSEDERNKGAVPRVTTVHEVEAAPRSRFWAVVAVAALLVLSGNALVLGLGLWDGRKEPPAEEAGASPASSGGAAPMSASGALPEPETETQAAPDQTVAETPPRAEPAAQADAAPAGSGEAPPAAVLEPAAGAVEPAAGIARSPVPIVRLREQPAAPAVRPEPPPRKPLPAVAAVESAAPAMVEPAVREPAAAPERQEAAVSDPEGAPVDEAGRSVPELWQLPSQIRSEIPPVTISVHVYSPDEAGRFVIVDRRKYWEGDLLQGGLLLESILPDGIVVEFRGRQFKLRSG